MIRSALAAFLGAAFGALTYAPATDRFLSVSAESAPLCALLFVATAAALLGIFIMACRDPVRFVVTTPFDDEDLAAFADKVREQLAPLRRPAARLRIWGS